MKLWEVLEKLTKGVKRESKIEQGHSHDLYLPPMSRFSIGWEEKGKERQRFAPNGYGTLPVPREL